MREQGIPLETFRVKDTEGRTIAAYRFADPSQIREGKTGGRKAFPKSLKESLFLAAAGKCAICLEEYTARELQIDHRIPYEVSGEPGDPGNAQHYMLLCGSCNRAKSWSCEHCLNVLEIKDPTVCQDCYWASPADYGHIALRRIRRLDLVWAEDETQDYEQLRQQTTLLNETLPDYVKTVLKKHISDAPDV